MEMRHGRLSLFGPRPKALARSLLIDSPDRHKVAGGAASGMFGTVANRATCAAWGPLERQQEFFFASGVRDRHPRETVHTMHPLNPTP